MLKICKMGHVYVELNGLVVRRPVYEAETVETLVMNDEVKHVARLAPRVSDLFARWTFHLRKFLLFYAKIYHIWKSMLCLVLHDHLLRSLQANYDQPPPCYIAGQRLNSLPTIMALD